MSNYDTWLHAQAETCALQRYWDEGAEEERMELEAEQEDAAYTLWAEEHGGRN